MSILQKKFNNYCRQLFVSLFLFLLCHLHAEAQNVVSFHHPDDEKIPQGGASDAIKLGHLIATNTPVYAPLYSGNALSCSNCHLDAGRKQFAAPWVGIVAAFPQYRARNDKVISLQDRINDCFQRSMNGKPLPPDSKEMGALMAYMTWLSQGVPHGAEVEGHGFSKINKTLIPNRENGQQIFNDQCAKCHGAQGQGLIGVNAEVLFPPLWGDKSFNIGAGMGRYTTAAAFIKTNMPKGAEGTLSDQDALDVAYFFTRQPRPDFKNKHLDWPAGNKPSDAPY